MKTDKQVQQDVQAELQWEPSVDAAQIGVEVKDGIVTLSGSVSSYAAKRGAENAAQRVAGVKALAGDMTVSIGAWAERTDSDIAKTAHEMLSWTTFVPKDSVKVVVENGWITLTGQVGREFQRRAACRAVRLLAGVTGVSDLITLNSPVSESIVKGDIESALARRAHADSEEIAVGVRGSQVTLTGTVHSLAERDTATQSAWRAPGVYDVVDRMTMAST
ncbi:MAG: BON domain-containing protein [Caldimonas sp.]